MHKKIKLIGTMFCGRNNNIPYFFISYTLQLNASPSGTYMRFETKDGGFFWKEELFVKTKTTPRKLAQKMWGFASKALGGTISGEVEGGATGGWLGAVVGGLTGGTTSALSVGTAMNNPKPFSMSEIMDLSGLNSGESGSKKQDKNTKRFFQNTVKKVYETKIDPKMLLRT